MLSSSKKIDYTGQRIFSDFLSEQYQHYLDDIIHLKVIHEQELEEIHDLLLTKPYYKPCDINQSIFLDRHFQIEDGLNGDITGHRNH